MLGGMRISAGRWAELVEAWGASGRTSSSFAAEHGIAEASLRWWKTELSRRARREGARRSPGPGRGTTRVAVARVVREGEVPPAAAERPKGSIELVLDGARVVLAPGFDARLLREVVRALSARP
jgi:transposase-like protein